MFGRGDKTRLNYLSDDRLLRLTRLTIMPEYRNETNSLGEVQAPADLNVVREMKKQQKLSPGDIIYALEMAIACAISYWIITYGLAPVVDRVVGIAVGIACRWIGSFLFVRKQERSMESY